MVKNGKDQEDKKKTEGYYQKGLVYGQQSDAEGAIECWQKAVELNPEFFDAWYNLGNAYHMEKGDFNTALKCWKRALELKPDDTDVLYNLANAYREIREFQKSSENKSQRS